MSSNTHSRATANQVGVVERASATAPSPPPNCTFEPADWSILARHWYAIALSRDLADQPTAVTLLDQPLVAYRVHGEVVVARDVCPHRGVPLSLARADGRGITCAYHGLRFAEAGRCVEIPAHPDAKIPARMHLAALPVVERFGLVWASLDPSARATAIPSMAHWDDPAFQRINCPSIDIEAFAGRQVEGFLDVAHFGIVHRDSFGDPDNLEVPAYRPQPTDRGFEVDYRSTVANYPHGLGLRAPEGFEWLRHFEVHLPFTATITVHFPDDGLLTIMNAATPVSARRTRMFAPIARNFGMDQPVEEVHAFNRKIFEEDRRIVEVQRPENLPLDPTIEVNIPADRSSVAYRRGLKSLGLSRFFTA